MVDTIKIELSMQEAQIVLNGLTTQPYRDSAVIIDKIMRLAREAEAQEKLAQEAMQQSLDFNEVDTSLLNEDHETAQPKAANSRQ